MTTYTYMISYINRYGVYTRVGFGSEDKMFEAATRVDREGGELLNASREVWEEIKGVARFIRIDRYSMGVPVVE